MSAERKKSDMFMLAACPRWWEGEIYDKFEKAAKMGFKAIEILNWLGLDLERIRRESERTGVKVSGTNPHSNDPAKNALMAFKYGITNAYVHDAFIDSIKETIVAAKIIGTKVIIAVTGNEAIGPTREEQRANIVMALRSAASLVENEGIMIVLEPCNTLVNHKGYYLTATGEAVEIIKEVGSPAVKVLYDIYHQQITEGNLINNITGNIQYIGHFHIGDVPGRMQPGTGEINYKNVFRAIRETGFAGYAAFECGITEDAVIVCPKMWALLE